MIEAAWVSSKSRLCASAPLASTASGGEAVRLAPITVQSPAAPQLSSMPRIEGAVSRVDAASARPMMSSVRSRTLATTSGGTAPKVRDAVNSARRRASVMRGQAPGWATLPSRSRLRSATTIRPSGPVTSNSSATPASSMS